MAKRAHLPLLAVLLCFLTFSGMMQPAANSASPRIVAIGDIHGAFPELVGILQRTALINSARQWIGGPATLIQIGDVLDRGAQTRDCLDLLMRLQPQAEKAGGKVVALLGNHEVMNCMADCRYVTPQIYGTFATGQSEKVREQAFKDYSEFLAAHRGHSHEAEKEPAASNRQKWMESHPLGFFEYRDAMSSKGKYGIWIRKHAALYQAGGGLFVHGGLNPALNFRDLGELNDQVRSDLARFDEIWGSLAKKKVIWRYMTLAEGLGFIGEELKWIQTQGQEADNKVLQQIQMLAGYKNWMAVSPDGPLWYRGLAQEPEEKIEGSLVSMLARLNLQFIVDGHTVASKSDIVSRFNSRVFLIDTGMLKAAYDGSPSALEIQNGEFKAYYLEKEPKVLAAPATLKKSPRSLPPPRRPNGNGQ